jgi:hypothetical protein
MAGEIIKLGEPTDAEKTTANIIKGTLLAVVLAIGFWKHEALASTGRDILSFAQDMVHAVILFVGLAIFYFAATSKTAKLAWRAVCNKLTGMVVDISPIGMLEALADEIVDRQHTVNNAETNLTATARNFEGQEKTKRTELEQALQRAEVADSEAAQTTFLQIAGRKEAKIKSILEMRANVDEGLSAVREVQRRLKYELINLKDETEELRNDNDLAIQLSGAAEAAAGALDNAQMEKIRFMAAQNVRAKYAKSLAQIDNLMRATENMAGEIDADNAIFRTKGAKALTEMRQRQQQLDAAPTPKLLGAGNTVSQLPSTNRWANKVR